jgi:3'-5' exoribonuclease
MKRCYISDLREGAKVEEVFLLAYKSVGNTRAGQPFLKMKLSDRTGTMDAVKWNATQTDLTSVCEMDFIVARGTVGK